MDGLDTNGWLVVFHCSNEMIRTGFRTAMSTLVLDDPQLAPPPLTSYLTLILAELS